MKTHLISIALAGALIAGCGGDSSPTSPQTIQLTASQATAIKNRVVQLAPVHPELAWLADSIALVVGAGVEVQQVDVTTNLPGGPFYAVSLQRTIRTNFSGASTFDIIMFNDPSNPTDFMIVSGWINPGNVDPPTSLSGAIGSTDNSTINAHFFHVDGVTVSAWRANAGTAAFHLGGASGTCSSVSNTATVTCQAAELNAAFNVTGSVPDNEAAFSAITASLPALDISGIIIRMLIQ